MVRIRPDHQIATLKNAIDRLRAKNSKLKLQYQATKARLMYLEGKNVA